MRRILAGGTVAMVAVVISSGAASAATTTWVVDDDGVQCAKADFASISEAVNAAKAGDTIKVCAGAYRERVTLDKPLHVLGQRDAVGRASCVDETWATTDVLDPTQFSIIRPPDDAADALVRLQANGVELAGLVVQGQTDPGQGEIFAPAIQADGAYAGHWVHHNLVQNNTLGIELGSNGSTPSRVDHNCLRGNQWAVANQRYTAAAVRVDHNEAFRTSVIPFEVGSTAGGVTDPRYVRDGRFDHNRSVGSGFAAFLVDRAQSVQLDHNTVEAPSQNGIYVRGENTDLVLSENHLSGTGTATVGIAVAAPDPAAPAPSDRVVVDHNTVERFNFGILLMANARTNGTQVRNNITNENRTAGIQIGPSNSEAVIQGNVSNNNVYGIRTASALVKGNTMVGNSMYGNSGFDAVESSFTTTGNGVVLQNVWQGNRCDTDSPAGAICVG